MIPHEMSGCVLSHFEKSHITHFDFISNKQALASRVVNAESKLKNKAVIILFLNMRYMG
jgi:hypothetical protein